MKQFTLTATYCLSVPSHLGSGEPIYSSPPILPSFPPHNHYLFCFLSNSLFLFSEEHLKTRLHWPWQRNMVQWDKRKRHMALLNCEHLWGLRFCTIPTAFWSSLSSDLSLFAEASTLLNSWPICLNFCWFSLCEEPRSEQVHYYAR